MTNPIPPAGSRGVPPSHHLPPDASKELTDCVTKTLQATSKGMLSHITETYFDMERSDQIGFSTKRSFHTSDGPNLSKLLQKPSP